jgi:50S ribosomal protein L16 3-hydroxylase
MLRDWLGAVTLDEFRSRVLRRQPAAQAGTTEGARAALDWETLDRVLRAGANALVVSQGRLLPAPPPRSLGELREYLAAGVGLCIQHAERHDAGLAAVAAGFAELGAAQVQVFVTAGGTHGFGWHYDDEDVFIAQTLGVKDYYFRANTVAGAEPAAPQMFARFPQEQSPLCTATLVPGDFLYLPSRWWHMALCREEALSISVGVTLRGVPSRPRASPERNADG